jgi:hypothetical protein
MVAFDETQPGLVEMRGDDVVIASFEQSEEVVGVAISDGRLLATLGQPLQPILAHRLQHSKARFPLAAFLLAQQALVDEGSNAAENIKRTFRAGDHLRSLDGAAPSKDGQPADNSLLLQGEEIVTPGNGVAHRLLSCRQSPCPSGQQRQAHFQALEQRPRRQDPDEGRSQLNGQRQAIEPLTDRHDRRVVCRQREVCTGRPRPLDK